MHPRLGLPFHEIHESRTRSTGGGFDSSGGVAFSVLDAALMMLCTTNTTEKARHTYRYSSIFIPLPRCRSPVVYILAGFAVAMSNASEWIVHTSSITVDATRA